VFLKILVMLLQGGRLGCLAIPATPDDPVMQASVNPKLEQKAKSPNGAGGALPENKSNAQKKKQQQQPDATKKGKEKQAEANTSSSSGRRLLGGTDGSVDPAVAARLEAFAAGREVMAFEGPWRHAKVIHFAAWPNKVCMNVHVVIQVLVCMGTTVQLHLISVSHEQ